MSGKNILASVIASAATTVVMDRMKKEDGADVTSDSEGNSQTTTDQAVGGSPSFSACIGMSIALPKFTTTWTTATLQGALNGIHGSSGVKVSFKEPERIENRAVPRIEREIRVPYSQFFIARSEDAPQVASRYRWIVQFFVREADFVEMFGVSGAVSDVIGSCHQEMTQHRVHCSIDTVKQGDVMAAWGGSTSAQVAENIETDIASEDMVRVTMLSDSTTTAGAATFGLQVPLKFLTGTKGLVPA